MDFKNDAAGRPRRQRTVVLADNTDPTTHRHCHTARVGSRTVTFRVAGDRVQAVWDRAPPTRWKPAQLAKYRRARDAFVARLDQDLGCKLDLDQARTEALVLAAEVYLKARAAGVTIALDAGEIRFHGDPLLVDAWSPVLRQHREALAAAP